MSQPELPSQPQNASSDRRLPPAPTGGGLRELLHDPLRFFTSLTDRYGDIVLYRPAPDPAYLINHPD
jgi:hypothetical protein